MMDIDQKVIDLMEKHGFGLGSSGGGCEWWTRDNGDGTFTAITAQDGPESPQSLNDPILVGKYSTDTGEALADFHKYGSLKEYFKGLF